MAFIDESYLLETPAAESLYRDIENLPILDPHSHIDVEALLQNRTFEDIWEVVGETDHYIWELMRKRGVPEERITGGASNKEKWFALAEVFPKFAGNPTYEWVHLDLKRRFGIDRPISADTATAIWTTTESMLDRDDKRPQELLEEMNVETIASTDDPRSSLDHHERLNHQLDGITVYPTWRPDSLMNVTADGWTEYVDDLGDSTDSDVGDFGGFLTAIDRSHGYFDAHGCRASDLGLEEPVSRAVSRERARSVYETARSGGRLGREAVEDFQAYLLETIGELNTERDWVTQFHIGALRDYRSELYEELGADSGGDVSTQNIDIASNLRYFLNRFDGELDVVLYTLDPTHYPTVTTLTRAFPRVSVGAAWWFNDSYRGMTRQIEHVGTVDLLANYAGMVSDSRKLISYGSRFELFRRSLANTVGAMVERGQMPLEVASDLVTHVAYDRPKRLWGF
jgi:glucuronate isomerase